MPARSTVKFVVRNRGATGDLGVKLPELTSFGVDGLGRVYVMSLEDGVYRLDPKQS